MLYLSRSILLLICLTVLFASFVDAQEKFNLVLNELKTFLIAPEQEKVFVLKMKKGEFADIQWLANEELPLSFEIYDSTRKDLLEQASADEDSIWFVAPKDGDFLVVCKFEKSTDFTQPQTISLQYKNKFKLPAGTKLSGVRKINGFDVKIMTTPSPSNGQEMIGGQNSIVLFEKSGQLQKIMKAFGDGSVAGFYFADGITRTYSKEDKQSVLLLKNTLDKTGNGIPDVMINYYSGGAHCCAEHFFVDLGEWATLADAIGTGHVGMNAKSKNPKGGLFYETADNVFAYWGGGFAGSPFPNVILEFKNGKLRPNFEQMRKPAPSLAVLKRKAQLARQKLSLEPYKGIDDPNTVIYKEEFLGEPDFWGEMLDLIYSGHEDLAWQYLDLVWSPQKQGKAIFIEDFKNQLNESDYWKMIQEGINLKK
jgi:hypothetical protein